MKPHDSWEVLPHGEIERLADNLWTVVGELRMPLGETPRRMTIVRLADTRLAIYSAIALDDARMQKLVALGQPAFLIVPSGIHRLDAKPWKTRFPDLVVIAPDGARDRIREVVPIDASAIDFHDPRVQLQTVPGTNGRELAMVVTSDTGKTLVVNDLIFNLPAYSGLLRLGLRVLGFGPGRVTMPKLVRKRLVADKAAVREQLRAWADLGLDRILVAHGAPIDNPRETLLQLAAA